MRIYNDPSRFGRLPDPPEPPSDEWFEEHCPHCGCQNIVGVFEKVNVRDIEDEPQESEE